MGSTARSTANCVGSGRLSFEVCADWCQLPAGWSFYEATSVATDSRDRAYVFNRGDHPVIVLNPDGTVAHAWGEGQFARPHGIFIGPDDMLYLTDDRDHTIHKFTPDGQRLVTLGTSGRPSDTGCRDADYRTIQRGGPPFNIPTNVALAAGGEMYVSDGYGNARIHKFSATGELLLSWGEPGSGPGQFQLPHGIAVDRRGRVFVADRENSRLQIFTGDGQYLEEWTDVARPTQVFIDLDDHVYVSELGYRAGLFPWMTADRNAPGGRVSVFDHSGSLLTRWGGGDPCAATDFYAPHDLWVDSQGNLYVAEVTMSAGGKLGLVPANCPSLRKFQRSS